MNRDTESRCGEAKVTGLLKVSGDLHLAAIMADIRG